MGGGAFEAAYIGDWDDPLLGRRIVIPNNKLYFIPVMTEDEAAYITGFLNAPVITRSISAYAAQLSLGTSVAEYLNLPKFDTNTLHHMQLAQISKNITHRKTRATSEELYTLDTCVHTILGIS
jgi:hypothetical protein